MLSHSGVAPEQVLGEFPGPEGVDAAFVALDGRGGAVERAFGFEARPGGPVDVVPGKGLEPVDVVVAAHMPEPPRDDRLGKKRAGAHAGTGSWAGSSAGAGAGTGSSSGAISISRSVSGAPMSIVASWGSSKTSDRSLSSEIRAKSYRASRMAHLLDQVAFAPVPSEFLFTSESVTEGHPDKVADQVSDTVLDAVLADDPSGRVACETLITTGLVVVAGEISTETYVDIPAKVRAKIEEIGYTHSEWGFDATTCGVVVAIDEQSPDIAQGVDASYEVQHDPGDDDPLDRVGAGDQGMMFGYATDETPELMPLPIMLAHKLARRLSEVRKSDVLPYLRPDGKTQVSIRYEIDEHGHRRPVEIERVLVSTQHREGLDPDVMIKPDIVEHVLEPILPKSLYDPRRLEDKDFVYVNPTGKFVIGGPMGDTGLTGRKVIVDTSGGAGPPGRRA